MEKMSPTQKSVLNNFLSDFSEVVLDGAVEELPSFNYLSASQRDAPCLEYPGKYLAVLDGEKQECANLPAANFLVETLLKLALNKNGQIIWEASVSDPRKNESWFRSSRQMG